MKKVLCIVCLLVLVAISSNILCFAKEKASLSSNEKEYIKEYNYLKERGALGEDITLEVWRGIYEQSEYYKKKITAPQSFHLVTILDSNGISGTGPYYMQKGDVFITSGTSSGGLSGHAGIAISSDTILHIPGPGEHPQTISRYAWVNNYNRLGWTRVYRHIYQNVASAAGQWAQNVYMGSNAEYRITADLASTNETYCSKIVWQAYYYGPETHYANGPAVGIRTPYELPYTIPLIVRTVTFEEQ